MNTVIDTTQQTPAAPAQGAGSSAPATPSRGGYQGGQGGGRDMRKNRRPSRRPQQAPRSEYEQKILNIRRVTRVSSGGRRFSFSVTLVIGNNKGKVGVGIGKAGDTALAIEKAFRDAKKNIVEVPLTETKSISHDVEAKYCSARVKIMPARGKGLVAGGAVRDILEFAGVTDVNSKIISGSKNALNNSRAALKALKSLRPAIKKN